MSLSPFSDPADRASASTWQHPMDVIESDPLQRMLGTIKDTVLAAFPRSATPEMKGMSCREVIAAIDEAEKSYKEERLAEDSDPGSLQTIAVLDYLWECPDPRAAIGVFRKHYGRADLSLKDIADRLGLSKTVASNAANDIEAWFKVNTGIGRKEEYTRKCIERTLGTTKSRPKSEAAKNLLSSLRKTGFVTCAKKLSTCLAA